MTTTMTPISKAEQAGREHRDAYRNEFGEHPRRDRVGDWDSTGWGEAWRAIDDPTANHGECREAYLDALFADRVACVYCHANGLLDEPVPAEDDDAAWERMATEHQPGCEWIATRAHRREPV